MADLNPNMEKLGSLLAKHYPRRGILLYKLLESIKTGYSSLSLELSDSIIRYSIELNQRCLPEKSTNKQHGDTVIQQFQKADVGDNATDVKHKSMLNFIRKLTLCPEQITQNEVQTLFDSGWSESEFLDSVYLCAMANCMNTFIHGLKFSIKK